MRGDTVRFSHDPALYFPPVLTRHEGIELMGFSPFIYAYGGRHRDHRGGHAGWQADEEHWWNWARARPTGQATAQAAADGGAGRAGGAARVRRGPRLGRIHPALSLQQHADRRRDDRRSPMWEIHPVACDNVTVRGVKIHSHGPNNDGCDPETCRDVLIEDCVFDTGDDCIAIKSRPQRRRPAAQRAVREHHHPRLHDDGRPWRRHASAARSPAACAMFSSRTARWTARTSTTRSVSRTMPCAAAARKHPCPRHHGRPGRPCGDHDRL